MKTDNPYSYYQECLVLFSILRKKLEKISSNKGIYAFNELPKRTNFLKNNMKTILLLISTLLMFGCTKAQFQEKKYTIKKGGQYSNTPHQIVGNKVQYQIKLDSTAIYKIDSINQYDINKLFGMSACNSLHHENSARFGWRWVNNQLEIHAYVYDMGKRFNQVVDTIQINEWNKYSIINTGSEYIFDVNEKMYVHKKSNNCKSRYNIALWPYFGGNVKAPQNIYFYFKK